MNSKRSYLDTLNAGRERRPHTTLEQLNRSLETLEQRLQRSREETADHQGLDARHAPPRYVGAQPYAGAQAQAQRPFDEPRIAQRPYDEPQPYQQARNAAPAFDQTYQSIARDIDRVRGQEDGVAVVGKIANELRGLREELRHQMTTGLRREFEALRGDIERASLSGSSARENAELGLEFERLSGAIQALAEKSDDRSVNMLRLELDQVRSALDTLAREESVQRVDRRWDDFYDRWNAFEDRVGADSRGRADDPALSMLTERLEQIGNAVNNLPESLSLRSLEDKVRTLAGAVDHFASQQGSRGGDILGLIDERLDEISRAIVASTVAAQANAFDPAPFERIEQRIAALAAQIEEVAGDRPAAEVIDRLNALSQRVDDLAARADLPEQAMERLAQQIALIADRIGRAPVMPDADLVFQGLEQRFDVLSGMIERRQGDALERGNMLFRDLERRLDEVVDRLDQRAPETAFDSAGIMDAIDARFTAMAKRLERRAPDPAGDAVIRGIESRLENISSRLDSSAAQVAGIDPDLIRSLEAQVAGLSAHLARPGTPLPDFEDIGPRLEEIERSLTGTRDSILEAARQAAENAVRSMAGGRADTAAVAGLAQDLKTLEALTRRSDERNSKTFEAIHDTLLKIVDRLGSLEGSEADPAEPRSARASKIAVQDAPTLEMDEPQPLAGMAEPGSRVAKPRAEPGPRTPAEAAAAAAMAALGSDAAGGKPEQGSRRKSMLGGLARAFSGKKETDSPSLAGSEPGLDAPTVDLDEPLDPKLANRPLEPGSGAPDLSAIMKRVRDERGQPARQKGGDAGNSDFIAAARRAAQAAAAEAEALKRQSTVAGPVRALRIGDLLKARRKPILMAAAAIMLALAGLQLGKAFLSDPVQTAGTEAAPIVSERQMDTASAAAASAPEKMDDAVAQSETGMPVRVVVGSGTSEPKLKDDMAASSSAMEASAESAPKPAVMAAAPAAAVDSTEPASVAVPPPSTASGSAAPTVYAPAAPDTTGAVTPADGAPAEPTAETARIDVPAEAGPAPLREAAADGDAKALFEIGSRYAEARGVKEDMAAAARWYEKSAELGFAPAEYRIGNFYEKGIGVKRDIAKAKTWYQLAAEQGNASAMHNLAVLFAMAADGVPDNESAARWFEAAAELGVKDSQFNLGILAAKGVGMKQNLEESYKWFALVANEGDKDAAAKRDQIAKELRPDQLERARAATELWKAKPLDAAANSVDIPEAWRESPATTASVDMKKAVQSIQRILNKNGYEAGQADGVMGEKTKSAIMAFQSDNELSPTGEVDEKLVKALLAHK